MLKLSSENRKRDKLTKKRTGKYLTEIWRTIILQLHFSFFFFFLLLMNKINWKWICCCPNISCNYRPNSGGNTVWASAWHLKVLRKSRSCRLLILQVTSSPAVTRNWNLLLLLDATTIYSLLLLFPLYLFFIFDNFFFFFFCSIYSSYNNNKLNNYIRILWKSQKLFFFVLIYFSVFNSLFHSSVFIQNH